MEGYSRISLTFTTPFLHRPPSEMTVVITFLSFSWHFLTKVKRRVLFLWPACTLKDGKHARHYERGLPSILLVNAFFYPLKGFGHSWISPDGRVDKVRRETYPDKSEIVEDCMWIFRSPKASLLSSPLFSLLRSYMLN